MITVETNLLAIPPSLPNATEGNFFKIVYGNQGVTNIIDVDQSLIEKGLQAVVYSVKSQNYLIKAVRNFIRKINFSELNESLEDGEINDEEYKLALEQDGAKYAITLRDIENPSEVLMIIDLINKIGYDLREFSTSEVAEMFSVKENQLISHIDSLRHQIK
jgi:hypothetical protein